MTNETPHPIRPLQPEFDFEATSLSPEQPGVVLEQGYDSPPPPEAIEVPPPPEDIEPTSPGNALPQPEYDEKPPPEAIEVPPPPETVAFSDEELDALDELNDAGTAKTRQSIAHNASATYIVAPPNFGEMLQTIRLEHRLTVKDLSEKAHLTETAIRDLESGDIARLNSNANFHYCRSQIERICQVYGEGISPEPILEAFELELQNHAPLVSTNDLLDKDTTLPEDGTRRFSSILISLVIILLLLLIVGGWAYKRYEISRQEKSSANYDLPSLVPPPQLPLTPLDIPTH